MDWYQDATLQKEVQKLVFDLDFGYIDPQKLIVFRSYGSKSRAIARIWSLPRIWQMALKISPHYCIEVISERFDKLSLAEKKKVLIHELLHIPKTFSGSLLPHRGRGKRKIDRRAVERLFKKL